MHEDVEQLSKVIHTRLGFRKTGFAKSDLTRPSSVLSLRFARQHVMQQPWHREQLDIGLLIRLLCSAGSVTVPRARQCLCRKWV